MTSASATLATVKGVESRPDIGFTTNPSLGSPSKFFILRTLLQKLLACNFIAVDSKILFGPRNDVVFVPF